MKIAIIGNGISGITAARHIRKLSDYEIDVISSETDHFFSRTALMYIYMGHMDFDQTKPYEDFFWKKNRINLVKEHVDSVDFNNKKLQFRSGKSHQYDKLILALGSKSNMFGWPGQDLEGVGGLYHFQDLQNMEKYSFGLQRAVIVGGGLIGIEMAEMFNSRKIPVTMIVREESYWNNVLPAEESDMINRHIEAHHIDLRLELNLGSINDDGNGKVKSITIKETQEEILCGYVGLTAGVSPNVGWLKESGLKIDRGIVVDNYLQTNIADVYAVGDCVQLSDPMPGRRNIEAVWYTGRMMGETAAYNVVGKKVKYDPGIWFNSAKFLDIEYQVYGDLPPTLPEELDTLYWEHNDGMKSIRINYEKSTLAVTGFNLMGVRFRHEVCEKWLANKTSIEDVLKDISIAYFDPEFYKSHSQGLIAEANNKLGLNIAPSAKKGWNSVFSFLNK